MSNQIVSVQVFADSGPNSNVNGERLNSHVDDATLLNGAVINQIVTTAPLAADTLLLGDSTAAATGVPKQVAIANLLIQSQRDGTQRMGGGVAGTNALTMTTTPPSTGSYMTGEVVRFVAVATNTGAMSVNLDVRGVKNLFTSSPVAAMTGGEILINSLVEAVFDGTQFQAVGVDGVKSNTSFLAAERLRGDVQQYAVATGTVNALVIAPVDSSGAPTFTAFVAGMMVQFKMLATAGGNTGAVTLAVTGCTGTPALVSPGGLPLVAGALTPNRQVRAVYDGTSFVVVSPLASWDFINTPASLPGSNTALVVPHGLGATPTKKSVVLINVTTNLGYSVNDELAIESAAISSNGTPAFGVVADATNITVTQETLTNPFIIAKSSLSGHVVMASADWKIKVYASL